MYLPLCGIFCLYSVAVAHYDALIQTKSPTKCEIHLVESLFQTRSSIHIGLDYAGCFLLGKAFSVYATISTAPINQEIGYTI